MVSKFLRIGLVLCTISMAFPLFPQEPTPTEDLEDIGYFATRSNAPGNINLDIVMEDGTLSIEGDGELDEGDFMVLISNPDEVRKFIEKTFPNEVKPFNLGTEHEDPNFDTYKLFVFVFMDSSFSGNVFLKPVEHKENILIAHLLVQKNTSGVIRSPIEETVYISTHATDIFNNVKQVECTPFTKDPYQEKFQPGDTFPIFQIPDREKGSLVMRLPSLY